MIFQVLQHLSVLIASKTLTFNVNLLLESLQNVQTLHTPINQHLRVADYQQLLRKVRTRTGIHQSTCTCTCTGNITFTTYF
jgi:hypothetical protein